MRSYNICFIAYPALVSSNPSAPIVSTLVRRGHLVTYPTTEKIAARIAATGAKVLSYPRPGWNPAAGWEEWQVFIVETLTSYFEKNSIDAVVYDLVSPAGAVLASRMKVPAIMTSNYFPFNEERFNEVFKGTNYRDIYYKSGEIASGFLERYNIKSKNYCFDHREKLNIYLFPREFVPDRVDDDRCFYSGRCAGEQVPFGAWSRGDHDERTIVLVATSTTYVQDVEYFRRCIEALAESGWRIVLSISDDADPVSLYPLPSNVEIVQKTSHTRILPYASLLIFLGGIVTSSEAAYHGVPLIITSCGHGELEGLGDNLARLGLGVHLRDNEMSPESLRKCAREVLESPGILQNVKELQRSVRWQAGAEEAANRIEEFIEENMK